MKRIVSALALLAFVVTGVAPCQAAIMSCGMKMPSPDDRCASCVTDSGSGPTLRAASCCRTEPGQDRSTAPAILAGAPAGSFTPLKAALAAIPSHAAAAPQAIGLLTPAKPSANGPPPFPSLTTVLRL